MRHACNCGLSYRNLHDLDEHKRVGCRVPSSDGPTWSDEVDEESTTEEVNQEVSPEPEPQEEKESSQCPEPTST
jgi:hypothetical protein